MYILPDFQERKFTIGLETEDFEAYDTSPDDVASMTYCGGNRWRRQPPRSPSHS